MKKKILSFRNKGETILEVVLAVVVLVLVLTSVFMILGQSISQLSDLRNRVFAVNLAREGIEIVRNVRDTNWLQFAGDKRSNWLCVGGNNAQGNYDPCLSKLTETSYVVPKYDGSQKRFLLEKLDTEEVDFFPKTSEDYFYPDLFRVFVKDGIYTHDSSGNMTPFVRAIAVEIQNPYVGMMPLPNFCNDELTCKNARLEVVSRVLWKEGSKINEVVLEEHLFDYLDRHDY